MKRRNLLKALTVSSIAPSVFPEKAKGEQAYVEPKKKVLMQVGCQSPDHVPHHTMLRHNCKLFLFVMGILRG